MQASDLGLLVLRLTVGLIFAAHGAQKAFGWWNGPGYAGWHRVIERIGFWPTSFWPAVSVAVELASGLALAIGFLTPLAAASIVAKVTRDRLMRGLHQSHPGYGWDSNMGSGTEAQLAAINRLGPCLHHRRSFAPIHKMLGPKKAAESNL